LAKDIQELIEELAYRQDKSEEQRDNLNEVVMDVRDYLDTLARDSGQLLKINKKLLKANAESRRLEKASNLQDLEDKREKGADADGGGKGGKGGKGGSGGKGAGGIPLGLKPGFFDKLLDGESIGKSISDGMAIATGMSLATAVKKFAKKAGPLAMKNVGKTVLAGIALAVMEAGKRLGDTFADYVREATGSEEAAMAADLATGGALGYAAGALVFRKFKFLRVIPAIGGMWYNMLDESEQGVVDEASGFFEKVTALIKAIPKTDWTKLDVSPIKSALGDFSSEIAVMAGAGALAVVGNIRRNVATGITGRGAVKGATGGIMSKMLGIRTLLAGWVVAEQDQIAEWIKGKTGSSTLGDVGALTIAGGTLGSVFGPLGGLVGALAGFAAGGAFAIANWVRNKAKEINESIRVRSEKKLRVLEQNVADAEEKLNRAKRSNASPEEVVKLTENVTQKRVAAVDARQGINNEYKRARQTGEDTVDVQSRDVTKLREMIRNETDGKVRRSLQVLLASKIKEINSQLKSEKDHVKLSQREIEQFIFDVVTDGGSVSDHLEERRGKINLNVFKRGSANDAMFTDLAYGDKPIGDMNMAISKNTKINQEKVQANVPTESGSSLVDASTTNIVNNNGGGGDNGGVVESGITPVTNPSFNYGGMF